MSSQILHIDPDLKQAISNRQAWHYRIIPKNLNNNTLELYVDQKKNINGIKNELEIVLGKEIDIESIDSSVIENSLKLNYPKNHFETSGISIPKLLLDKENFIGTLIEEALSQGSSDIHFESQEKISKIRYRIDGHLVDKYTIPITDYPAIVNAIKIKSNLDIAEKRLPQDGRIFFNKKDKKLDIRVSIVPTIHGEKIVFRLLNKDTSNIDLDKIGLHDTQLESYKRGFLRSHGLVLISGPTGSGKTTTLYATLKQLNTKDKNILTIEDPIEYTLGGINQVQLKEGIGLTFPVALRTFLRQDPDIIMVGEIRDPETAQIAIRSSLTGHLVLSTIHTNSALGIVSRLMDMGIPEYLISATLNIAVAQRLIRKLCPSCKYPSYNSDPMRERFLSGWQGELYEAKGCPECNYTGYKGRKAIFEVVEIDDFLRDQIKNKQVFTEQTKEALKLRSLAAEAKEVLIQGETSISEILPILLNT